MAAAFIAAINAYRQKEKDDQNKNESTGTVYVISISEACNRDSVEQYLRSLIPHDENPLKHFGTLTYYNGPEEDEMYPVRLFAVISRFIAKSVSAPGLKIKEFVISRVDLPHPLYHPRMLAVSCDIQEVKARLNQLSLFPQVLPRDLEVSSSKHPFLASLILIPPCSAECLPLLKLAMNGSFITFV